MPILLPAWPTLRSLVATGLALLAATALVRADEVTPIEVAPIEVAPGVFAFIADTGEVAPANRGRVGNSGFIVGATGIAVIDTGVSFHHGADLLAAIRTVSDLPVTTVIITHAVQEFLFGNAAFEPTGARFIAHRRSIELMRQRCDHCLQNLRLILGDAAMAGTRLLIPGDVLDSDSERIDIGGRELDLLQPGWASTPGDLLVLDPATVTLFAGGVVSIGRIPELRDGNLAGWMRALEELPATGARLVVPGHGPPVDIGRSRLTLDYLQALERRMRDLYEAGTSLMDAIEASGVPAFAGWAGYATIHRRNALERYLQLELDDLGR